ncbi:transcriptional regulator, XRE family [Rubrobacter xylanophilus DSM 9941]|uniref:Transcriptional regulator, XRE family n=1 Tax=Rubrobacter xylanophilus (strain DSM 9941 / JCM 11954 / NBRC 16129 / PRD-1) TaxID=266117 RepID=Q1AXI4_RUBXD|nr:helix-turn-helix transcriptional regulator [Rubrobacter xylanophilus]ABG03894.1 transcriptional regulator, XRE family [Rubrobacter xylanophilus DSM 9941]
MQLYLVDGARLRELRERAGLSQEELSEIVGYSRTWVAELERQSRTYVLEILVQKLVAALGVGISDLSAYPEPPAPPAEPEDLVVSPGSLRALRERAGLSQEELERRAGLAPGSVARAEGAGEGDEIRASVETLWRLARALETSPTHLVARGRSPL